MAVKRFREWISHLWWAFRSVRCQSCRRITTLYYSVGCGAAGGIDTTYELCLRCIVKERQLVEETYGRDQKV
jgi:hypothetical protein